MDSDCLAVPHCAATQRQTPILRHYLFTRLRVASSNAIVCVCVIGIIPICSQELISSSRLWYSKHLIITSSSWVLKLVKYFNRVFTVIGFLNSLFITTKYSLILGSPTGYPFQFCSAASLPVLVCSTTSTMSEPIQFGHHRLN
jgi:formate-dependent nitrite reductase membrane component NrfD